jgi:hypothetical protein
MNRLCGWLLLLCSAVTLVPSGASTQNAEVTPTLGVGDPTEQFPYYDFEVNSGNGYLHIELALNQSRGFDHCSVEYRRTLRSIENAQSTVCKYDPAAGSLSVDFKKNSVGLVSIKARLGAVKDKVLWQRTFSSDLSFADKTTLQFIATETGKYFLQNKPNCQLSFLNEGMGEAHEFRSGPYRIDITLGYARDNQAFINNVVDPRGWKLQTLNTDYGANTENYEINVPRTADIVEILDQFSAEKRVLCVTYENIKEF